MHRILFDELTIVINGRNSLAPCRIYQDRHNFTAFFCSLLLSVDWLKHTQRQRRLVACRLVGLLSSRNTFHVRRALLALVIEFVGCAKYPIHKEFALFKWNPYQFTLSNGWYGIGWDTGRGTKENAKREESFQFLWIASMREIGCVWVWWAIVFLSSISAIMDACHERENVIQDRVPMVNDIQLAQSALEPPPSHLWQCILKIPL